MAISIHMVYLGIDYGERRIGLAKGDDRLKVATPFKTVTNESDILNVLADIVKTEVIEKIIVGIPMSFDGGENEFTEKIMEFAEDLEARTGLAVATINEIFSSKIAAKNSSDVDASSAALILQTYLDQI